MKAGNSNALLTLFWWKWKAYPWEKSVVLVYRNQSTWTIPDLSTLPTHAKVLWLMYTRTHCSLKQAQIFKFVLPNDCEVQRFATRYGKIVLMRLSLLKGSNRFDVRKLAVSIARNVWKRNVIVSKLFTSVIGNRLNLIHLDCNTGTWLPSFHYSEGL